MSKSVLNGKKTLHSADDLIGEISKKLGKEEIRKLMQVELTKIQVKNNPRKKFEGIDGLAQSIEKGGLINPVTLKSVDDSGVQYLLIAGERRLRATVLLHKKCGEKYSRIEALVYTKEMSEDEIEFIQLAENVQRNDMTPQEVKEAVEGFKQKGYTLAEIAQTIGVSIGHIKNIMSTINMINNDEKIKTLMEGNVNITFTDYQEVKSLPEKYRLQLLEEKGGGHIRTVKELREKVNEIKEREGLKSKTSAPRKKHSYLTKPMTFPKAKHKAKFFNQTFNIRELSNYERDEIIHYARCLIQFLQGKRQS